MPSWVLNIDYKKYDLISFCILSIFAYFMAFDFEIVKNSILTVISETKRLLYINDDVYGF